MDNLELYNKLKTVPEEAKREIKGGRLSGMTDINPMWRIKVLTEHFGVCGFGWKYEIAKQWIEEGSGGQKSAFTNINLYVKQNDEWSAAIPANGGSSFIANEKSGAYTSDECFKMSLTDALSVACKALGIAADVYFAKDITKYDTPPQETAKPQPPPTPQPKPLSAEELAETLKIALASIEAAEDRATLTKVWKYYSYLQTNQQFSDATAKKAKQFPKQNDTTQ